MSTVAWDGKTLAADKQSHQGDLRRVCTKIHQCKDGTVIGFVGETSAGQIMTEWYMDGEDFSKYPASQKDDKLNCYLIVAKKNNPVYVYSYLPIGMPEPEGIAAWGSGRDFALGAMAMGANATQAVKVASQFDINTGMGVDYFDVAP